MFHSQQINCYCCKESYVSLWVISVTPAVVAMVAVVAVVAVVGVEAVIGVDCGSMTAVINKQRGALLS